MIKKKLDNLEFPAIGQGIGYYSWNDSHIDIIHSGIDLGMNFIDTAENYDKGNSEKIVGKTIKDIRENVIIGTKFSPENNSYENVIKSAEESLKRLKIDYIDLYQLHWPNPSIPLKETMLAMERLVDEGKIRHIGVCNMSLKELQLAQSFIDKKIVSLQIEYNLFDRTIEKDIIPFCSRNKIFIIAYSPLDQGRIADSYQRRELLKRIALKYNKTPAQIALRFLIDKPSVIVIPKTTNISHIKENCSSSDFNIDDIDIKDIDKIFQRKVVHILPEKIRVSTKGERNRIVYQTLEDAKENKLGYVPSPEELSKNIDNNIKPVRLIKTLDDTGKYEYDLIEGRIRYWAWIMTKGNVPIPALLREN